MKGNSTELISLPAKVIWGNGDSFKRGQIFDRLFQGHTSSEPPINILFRLDNISYLREGADFQQVVMAYSGEWVHISREDFEIILGALRAAEMHSIHPTRENNDT